MLQTDQAVQALRNGDIVAYPTEGVYGLGCDPHNEAALHRLLALKARAPSKGLILIGGTFAHLAPYMATIPPEKLARVRETWPGPVTWTFPVQVGISPLLCGAHHSIALRLSAHPPVVALCAAFGGAIVSTSANISGAAPMDCAALLEWDALAGVLIGPLGGLDKPTPIYDAQSGEIYRR